MAAQPIGSEFLLRRLRRATAIPPAERPPDVAAFVESVQLLREACDLLPLTRNGKPALQLGKSKARQQVSLALLKSARADYICPRAPVSDRQASGHFYAYCSGGPNTAAGDQLTTLLIDYTMLQHSGKAGIEDVCGTAPMLDRLADPAQQQAITGQLAQLSAAYSGQPLLSFNQLHYACCCAVAQAVQRMCARALAETQHLAAGIQPSGSAAQRLAAASAAARAAATLVELEPQNPKSYAMAAAAVRAAVPETLPATEELMLRIARLNVQGAQLAREQGHMYFTALCAAEAVQILSVVAQDHPDSWHAAVAACEGAEAAVHACKRLLPAAWVDGMKGAVQMAQQSILIVQRQLQQQPSTRAAPTYYAELRDLTVSAVADSQRLNMCDGCGQEAAGLRRCARCKKAQYCSTECQHKHWRTHKRECRAT